MDGDDFYDDSEGFTCPRCSGSGEVNCHCGGDQCYCDNYGDAPCPVCYGEGKVTEARYDLYMERQRENARLMAEVWAKIEAEKSESTPQ